MTETVHTWCWKIREHGEYYMGEYIPEAEDFEEEEVTIAFWEVEEP